MKEVTPDRLGAMLGGATTKAQSLLEHESSRYHTRKSGRIPSHASSKSFRPATMLNATASQKVIRDRGMAHERNLSLSQIEYGKRDYSPIITTSKHDLRKIYDPSGPKRKHVHSASVQTNQRRQT